MKKSLANKPAPRQTHPRLTLPVKVISGLALISPATGLGLLASRPAHTAGGPIAVNVANAPLPTTDTTLAGRTPFSKRLDLAFVFGLSTVNGGAEVKSHLPTTAQGGYLGKDVFATSAPMTVYADPVSTVTFAALEAEGGAGETGGLVVSLYRSLENV